MAIFSSLVSASTAAVIIGAIVGKGTDGNWLRGALRQLALVVLAAGVTYEIGHLFRLVESAIR